MLNIFLTNLGLYNEGILSGEWVSLPVSGFDLEAVKIRIGVDERHEETFITDYETDINGVKVGEYDSIDELNELAKALEDNNAAEIIGQCLKMVTLSKKLLKSITMANTLSIPDVMTWQM